MLEKQRESFAASKNYQKVKLHLQRNKQVYLAGGVGVGIGMLLKQRPQVTHVTNNVTPSIAPVFNNDNSSVVNFGGHMTKIVKCCETGEMWEKVTEAAKAADVPLSYMSRHLNEHTDHVKGLHYQIIGMGTA